VVLLAWPVANAYYASVKRLTHLICIVLALALPGCLAEDPLRKGLETRRNTQASLLQATNAPRALDPVILEQRSFSESPDLEQQFATGSLPPVSERLPANPLVVVPIEDIGRYGGQIRRDLSSDISQ